MVMTYERDAVSEMTIDKRNRSTRRKPSPQCHIADHKSHMMWPNIGGGGGGGVARVKFGGYFTQHAASK
jgi:hypothetical protein